jgi:insertion element IS1 protein InsB
MNPYFINKKEISQLKSLEVEIHFTAEMDEFWSFVGNKSNQRWTWYAIERNSGIILAWHNGKRQDKDFEVLWSMLANFPIACYYTDEWGSYLKYIPANMHRTG